MLRRSWELIHVLERLPHGEANRLFADELARREAVSRAALAPPDPWPGLPDTSLATYRGGANTVRVRRVLEFLTTGDRVLDIGIGYGYVSALLMRSGKLAAYRGTDLTQRYIDTTAEGLRRNGVTTEAVELEVLDLYDIDRAWVDELDPTLVLALEVLEHVPDASRAFRILGDALPLTASLLFTVPMLGRLDGVWGHRSLFPAERVRWLCEQAGLHIHHVEPVHNMWMLVLASRAPDAPARLTAAVAGSERLEAARAPVGRHDFVDIEFGPPTLPFVRRGRPGGATSSVRADGHGLTCRVEPDGRRRALHYGGAGFDAEAPGVIRLSLSFHDREEIAKVVLAGGDDAGRTVGRWPMRADPAKLPGEPKTYVVRTRQPGGAFRPSGTVEVDRIARIELSLGIATASPGAGFTIHRAAYA